MAEVVVDGVAEETMVCLRAREVRYGRSIEAEVSATFDAAARSEAAELEGCGLGVWLARVTQPALTDVGHRPASSARGQAGRKGR